MPFAESSGNNPTTNEENVLHSQDADKLEKLSKRMSTRKRPAANPKSDIDDPSAEEEEEVEPVNIKTTKGKSFW